MATVFDLDVQDLPEGWTPLEAVIVVLCIDDEGQERAVLRGTDLQGWQIVGLLRTAESQVLGALRWEDEE